MLRTFAGCTLFLILFVSQNVFSRMDDLNNKDNIFVFSSKVKALQYAEKKKLSGLKANTTTQHQNRQRYVVYLKGYRQWSVAFKQAQTLEKMGYKKIEVRKDKQGRSYSIIVAQLLNKKKAGQVFNKLRAVGLKNVKVKTDMIKLTRYIVKTQQIPVVPIAKTKPVVDEKKTQAPIGLEIKKPVVGLVEKVLPPEKEEPIVILIDEDSLTDDEMMIVMSDESDVTFDIKMDDELEAKDVVWAIDKMVLEEELFTRSSSDVTNVEYAHISSHVNWQVSDKWDVQLAARIDAYNQHGKRGTDVEDATLDYEENYLRYRDDHMRVTVGTQTIRWGRVDVLAPTDNMVTLDLSRGVLPNWDDLYRSSLAIRGEFFSGQSKLDFVYLPKFREAQLAEDDESVWYPVNFRNGEILGGKSSPLSRAIIQNATIDDHINGDGGLGFRFSSNVNSVDYALTLQRVRLSAPSYKINEQFRQDLLVNPLMAIANQGSYGDTYTEEHPRNWIVGGDMAFQWKQVTLRFEGAWFSDMPATTENLEFKTYDGFKWATGMEFYPGDADTRVILQLSGNHIDEKEKIVDRDNSMTLSGESETLFSNNRWRLSTKFSLGLDIKDIYISPELSYLGWEPFEIYSAVHYLDGSEQSLGHFYQENSMITVGWRGRY